MAKVGDIEIKLKVDTKKFTNDMKKAEKAAKKFSKNTTSNVKRMARSVKNSLKSVKGAVAGLAGAFAVFKGVSATKNLITDMTQLARVTTDWSKTLKTSTTDLQGFGLAAGTVGLSMEKVTDIFKDVSEKVGEFTRTGGGEAKDVFEQLGLSISDLKGKAPDKVLQTLSDRMAALKGTVNELSEQEEIFLFESMGNDVTLLIPLLAEGGKKLKEFKDIAEKSGAILSPEDIEALNSFRKITDVVKLQWQGLKNIIGIELLPSITELTQKIKAGFENGSIQKFVKTTAKAMGDMFTNAIKKIPMMVAGFKKMVPVMKNILSIIKTMVDSIMLVGKAVNFLGTALSRGTAITSALTEGLGVKAQTGDVGDLLAPTNVKTEQQAVPQVDSIEKIMRGLLKDRAASDAARIQKEAADKQAEAAKEQQAAAQLVKKRSETAIGQILGSRGKGETARILGEGPKQAQSDRFDTIFRDIVNSIQSGDADKRNQDFAIDMLNQIAKSQGTFGEKGSNLGMLNAIKDLQNFISGKKDDEIKVKIEVDVKPSDKFDTELETKIERINGNSFGDAAAQIGQ